MCGYQCRHYFSVLSLLQNLSIFSILQKRMSFYEVTGGPRRARPSRRALSFRDISMGETAGLQLDRAGAMRRGQDSPVDMLLKRPAREPWN